ncbi:MAG TPA: outer membrane beta-barrel protein [Flavisolibacter sp.]|nr:outer membrane beta-barrel protein [Flavisolibacter sp.]
MHAKSLKYLVFAWCSILSKSGFAQVHIGLSAGLTHSAFQVGDPASEGVWVNSAYTTNMQAGILTEIPLKESFFLQSCLFLAGVGSEVNQRGFMQGMSQHQLILLTYAELPFQLLYKRQLNQNWRAIIGGGFYLGYGIKGTQTGVGISNGQTYVIEEKVAFSNEQGQHYPITIRPFDFGGTAQVGVERKQFQLSAGFRLGFTKLLTEPSFDEANYRNKVFSLSLAYYFLQIGK